MKPLFFIPLAALALLGCGKTAPEPVVLATPSPTPAALSTPAPRLAPEGIYFVVQRISVATPDGVVGVAAGTRVKLIHDDIVSYHVQTDDGVELDIPREHLTHDRDTAALLNRTDRAARVEVATRLANERAQVLKEEARNQAEFERRPPMPAPRGTANATPRLRSGGPPPVRAPAPAAPSDEVGMKSDPAYQKESEPPDSVPSGSPR